jgi:hypothetical protein
MWNTDICNVYVTCMRHVQDACRDMWNTATVRDIVHGFAEMKQLQSADYQAKIEQVARSIYATRRYMYVTNTGHTRQLQSASQLRERRLYLTYALRIRYAHGSWSASTARRRCGSPICTPRILQWRDRTTNAALLKSRTGSSSRSSAESTRSEHLTHVLTEVESMCHAYVQQQQQSQLGR